MSSPSIKEWLQMSITERDQWRCLGYEEVIWDEEAAQALEELDAIEGELDVFADQEYEAVNRREECPA
jgi:hypothetical protein